MQKHSFTSKIFSSFTTLTVTCSLMVMTTACSSSKTVQELPDKSAGGTILGAAWGAGTGAIIGHQFGHAGEGVAVGAALGALGGLTTGAGLDSIEKKLSDQEEQLETVKAQNDLNTVELLRIQQSLDYPPPSLLGSKDLHKIFFDPDVTSIKTGSEREINVIAESLKRDPYIKSIVVGGHTDDTGTPDYNQKIAESRARTVSSLLCSKGVSADKVKVETHGATQPLASNASPEGRQLNRRVEIVVKRY